MITIAVQAGGRSSRMGRDKALVPLGGKPLIEHVLARLEGFGDEVLVTTNRPEEYAFLGQRLVEDADPGAGALHGLSSALGAAQGDRVVLVGCDMPFVSRPLIEHMLQVDSEADVVVPRFGERLHPLHAIYAKSCSTPVREALAAGEKRMISFFPQVQVQIVEQEVVEGYDPAGLSFFNVNTPEDLAEAERLLGEANPP